MLIDFQASYAGSWPWFDTEMTLPLITLQSHCDHQQTNKSFHPLQINNSKTITTIQQRISDFALQQL